MAAALSYCELQRYRGSVRSSFGLGDTPADKLWSLWTLSCLLEFFFCTERPPADKLGASGYWATRGRPQVKVSALHTKGSHPLTSSLSLIALRVGAQCTEEVEATSVR